MSGQLRFAYIRDYSRIISGREWRPKSKAIHNAIFYKRLGNVRTRGVQSLRALAQGMARDGRPGIASRPAAPAVERING